MRSELVRRLTLIFSACTLAAATAPAALAAGNVKILYSFTGGNDGGNAATGLTFDGAGNAYGTTVVGGAYGCGTVFELKAAARGRHEEKPLYQFTCGSDGKNPHGGVTFDPTGNLYGTTVAGGSGGLCAGDGCGTAFQLTPSGETVLHNFTGGRDGYGPGGGVVFDAAGNLYGTTPDGGAHRKGTVYQLVRSASGWQENVIHTFTGGIDGAVGSLGLLLVDKSGNLYGVTELGGAHGAGTVFKLSHAAGKWDLDTLYAFKGAPDAGFPYGGLVADAKGDLFGTTYYGGSHGAGAVFELVANRRGWSERVIYNFTGGRDGGSPTSSLVFDKSGALYGTASAGGQPGCSCGVVFKLSPNQWTESVLHAFASTPDGAYPYYGLAADANGDLFGTTVAGGLHGQGTIFELVL